MNRRSIAAMIFLSAAPAFGAMTEPQVMPNLRAPDGERVAFILKAQGVQVYACKARVDDPYAYAWSFVAPEATLSEEGNTVGRHFAGPTWASTSDRSRVKAAVRERQDGGAGNIPWLLLTATADPAEGKFAGVTSIQRVATYGGVEPGQPCTGANAGTEARVPYTADYVFYKRT
jgi:hypothetical protein